MHKGTAERFWAKVDKTEGCWLWIGATSASGYGNFKVRSYVNVQAHRWSYELARGPIADGLVIDHLCRMKSCVNPAHLEAVTSAENTYRGESPSAINRRKEICSRGHEPNWYVAPRTGKRRCRDCHAENLRAYYAGRCA